MVRKYGSKFLFVIYQDKLRFLLRKLWRGKNGGQEIAQLMVWLDPKLPSITVLSEPLDFWAGTRQSDLVTWLAFFSYHFPLKRSIPPCSFCSSRIWGWYQFLSSRKLALTEFLCFHFSKKIILLSNMFSHYGSTMTSQIKPFDVTLFALHTESCEGLIRLFLLYRLWFTSSISRIEWNNPSSNRSVTRSRRWSSSTQ